MVCFNHFGGMAEWLKALVLKTSRAKALVGSNPTSSAKYSTRPLWAGFSFLYKTCSLYRDARLHVRMGFARIWAKPPTRSLDGPALEAAVCHRVHLATGHKPGRGCSQEQAKQILYKYGGIMERETGPCGGRRTRVIYNLAA